MPCRVPKRRFSCGAPQHLTKNLIYWFYYLFWGAKVTAWVRVLSAPTFFNKKIGICTQILYN